MRSLLFVFSLSTLLAGYLAACGGDDDSSGADATPGVDGATCHLESTPVECTEGDDTPCQALCASSYCHYYDMIDLAACTNNCSTGLQCPDGWECNNMGRCRPPGFTDG
jgi:hypothetical protein